MNDMPVESIRMVRDHMAVVVDRAERDGEPTVITRRGKEVAAVVPIELLRRYQRFEEQEIARIVRERMGGSEPGIPLAQVMAETLARPE
ncbi:type II toxin-antitoxin system Phd/YefM family antitoxin [Nocardiopsis sp. RSe5-2]|uniref:Antitoxin n=1 Tax=Nocardiopsis endophytica TaxID=3018445 RepID=A0ABT4U8N1_9ACTN|nr:type II toxin-antitoxin system Phd/YefM family antitoxin [Nocardiopsis endophytica]MDA2813311.1 type II toxin-antitoxin system Phd/YefM family antitoxin [Nocardiopsis endophytica]